VIACWRRVQEWAIVPTIAEFRMFTFPHKLFDFEQMIEIFNTDLVDMKALAPESYVLHDNIKVKQFSSSFIYCSFIDLCIFGFIG
jgi:hypothetical protein